MVTTVWAPVRRQASQVSGWGMYGRPDQAGRECVVGEVRQRVRPDAPIEGGRGDTKGNKG